MLAPGLTWASNTEVLALAAKVNDFDFLILANQPADFLARGMAATV
jgi:hypothetical protein